MNVNPHTERPIFAAVAANESFLEDFIVAISQLKGKLRAGTVFAFANDLIQNEDFSRSNLKE